MPILDQLRSGTLDAGTALALLTPLREVMCRTHARGLAHGSIVPGNVMIEADGKSARLLDFGLRELPRPSTPLADLMSADRTGLTTLERRLITAPRP